MSLSKLSPECEKCAYVRWCPNKSMVAMMELPMPSRTIDELALERVNNAYVARLHAEELDLARQRPANLDGVIENLREELARYYGVPKCFFGETRQKHTPL